MTREGIEQLARTAHRRMTKAAQSPDSADYWAAKKQWETLHAEAARLEAKELGKPYQDETGIWHNLDFKL